jgi:hypothetical protein
MSIGYAPIGVCRTPFNAPKTVPIRPIGADRA